MLYYAMLYYDQAFIINFVRHYILQMRSYTWVLQEKNNFEMSINVLKLHFTT